MSLILVDTDWIIDALHALPPALATLAELEPQGLAVSVISYGEVYEGAYHGRDPATAMTGLHDFLDGKDLLPITRQITAQFAIVRGQLPRHLRQQIGDMDLLIAATALIHDLTLLTRNVRDFQHIPGLQLYQPSDPTPSS